MQEHKDKKYATFFEELFDDFKESLKSDLHVDEMTTDEELKQLLISIINEYENEFYNNFTELIIYNYYKNLLNSYNNTLNRILKATNTNQSFNNDEKEISITIGEFGYIETGIVDVLPCNERVEMQLREDGEDINAQRTKQLEDLKTRYGQEEIHELVHKYSQELYEKNKKENNINDLQDEQRIYTSEEEEIIREEARKADISVEEFKNELMQIPDDYTLEEKIPLVHEKLEKEGPELEY